MDESLHQFFAAYFHEDWNCDDETWQAVVDRFRSCASTEYSHQVAAALRTLLASDSSEHDLSELLFQHLGCYYAPLLSDYPGHAPTREWLKQVCERLEGKDSPRDAV